MKRLTQGIHLLCQTLKDTKNQSKIPVLKQLGRVAQLAPFEFRSPWLTLDYARQLDKKVEPRDTADRGDSEVGKKQPQSRDTSGSIDEVKRLKGECKRLQNLVSDMRIELYHTPPIPSPPEIELPEAADLLNRLKAKRKKSAVTLADMEAILEMIEE